jgi:ribonuclease P protein component
MPSRYRWPRQRRLRSASDIARLRRQGQPFHHRLAVLLIQPNEQADSQIGFSVGKRIGPAVTRNRVKRRLREATRLQMAHVQPGWNCLFIARPATANASYAELETAVRQLFQQANLWQESNDQS